MPDLLPETAESVVRHIGGSFQKMGVETLYSWILPYASAQEPLAKLPRGVRRGKMKQCFENAFKAADEQYARKWKYAEGYAIGAAGIPIHHAWAIDENGKAVEVTWKEPGSYFGIPFEVSVARKVILKHKVWGLFPHGIKELEPHLRGS